MRFTQIIDRPGPRRRPCRADAHVWTDMATPAACIHCGRIRRVQPAR
jgi:hypothetical protein